MKAILRHPITWVVLAAAVVAFAVAMALFQPWRLFTTVEVNEGLPGVSAPAADGRGDGAAIGDAASGEPGGADDRGDGELKTLAEGRFVSHEHTTSGVAKVLELGDGRRVLRIENLDTSDGPDLRVWLSDQPVREGTAGWFNLDDGRTLELGELKGNKGNANYPIPASADLKSLKSVSIWCARFSVSFGAATLA